MRNTQNPNQGEPMTFKAFLSDLLDKAVAVHLGGKLVADIDELDETEQEVFRLSMDDVGDEEWFFCDQEISVDAQGKAHVVGFDTEEVDGEETPFVIEFLMHRPLVEADLTA